MSKAKRALENQPEPWPGQGREWRARALENQPEPWPGQGREWRARALENQPQGKSDEWGWEAHRLAQLRAGLRMTPAERLEWLEQTNAQMRELLGLARRVAQGRKPNPPDAAP